MNRPPVNHFKRSRAMIEKINDIRLNVLPALQDLAISALGEYKSRGHGKGLLGKNYFKNSSKYKPHQGKQECARRMANLS